MKRTFTITISKTITVDIDDAHLTPEFVADFSTSIYAIQGKDDLLEHAAMVVAAHGDHFVEGIGKATSFKSTGDEEGGRCPIEFEVVHVDVTCDWDKSNSAQKIEDDLTFNG